MIQDVFMAVGHLFEGEIITNTYMPLAVNWNLWDEAKIYVSLIKFSETSIKNSF